MKRYVVYGSLLEGLHNHKVLADSKFLGSTTIDGFNMYDTGFGYPMLLKGTNKIKVEVYQVNSMFVEEDLDMLEGYNPRSNNNLYDKIEVSFEIDGVEQKGYLYVWGRNNIDISKMELIKSGDWRKYYGQRY